MTKSATYHEALCDMEILGIWNEVTLARNPNFKRHAFCMNGQKFTPSRELAEEFPEWDDATWRQLLHVIQQIQDDNRPDGMNPHNMKIPLLGRNAGGKASDVRWGFHGVLEATLYFLLESLLCKSSLWSVGG